MGTPEIRVFSLDYEVDKLKKMLGLPVTNIVFDERYDYGKLYLDENNRLAIIYAQLYVNDDLIGTIPYMSDRWGPMYDTMKQQELAWDKIYRQFEHVIFDKIVQQEPLANSASIKGYKTIGVNDKEGAIIKTAYCNYTNDEWVVRFGDHNPTVKRLELKINITPPAIP